MSGDGSSAGDSVEILRGAGRRTVVRLPTTAFAGVDVPTARSVVAEAGPDHVDLFVSPALRLNIAARHPLLSAARNLAAAALIAEERDQCLWDVDVALALGAEPTDGGVKEWRAANGVPKPPASWPKGWSPSSGVVERARAHADGRPAPAPPDPVVPTPEPSPPVPIGVPRAGLNAGDKLAGYRIQSVLGRGGMGVVYSALEENLNRPVALKIITPGVADDAETRQRFIREARTAASIEHPHAVPIHAIGEADGLLYIAMRRINGPTLNDVIEREVFLDPARAARIVGQIADVLDAAHEAEVVHRDVKPQNILLGSHGALEHGFLSDFGLARLMQDTGLTRTGESLGTPSYMAPEQIRGAKEITPAADIYSLGCVMFECVTGDTPYPRDSYHAVMFAHLNQPPPAASEVNSQVPSILDPVIQKALAKEPTERFGSAGDFAAAVFAALDEPSERRPKEINDRKTAAGASDVEIADALQRLVALGDRGDYFAKAVILRVDDSRNYYVQFAVDEGGLFCEVVHNKYLKAEHAFTGDDIAKLLALGFAGPDYADQNLVRVFQPETADDYAAIVQRVRTVVADFFGLPREHPLEMDTHGLDD